MKRLCTVFFSCAFLLFSAVSAMAEGFSMSEWSARGLGLAGGMVGRADDPSALAYNPAGITQLPGTQFMLGASAIKPYGQAKLNYNNGTSTTSDAEPHTWTPPHGYLTYQLNDNIWLGLASYSRFGLGNGYTGDFAGRYNVYDVGLDSMSVVPVMAYKVNDYLSLALGIEAMRLHLYEGVKVPTTFSPTQPVFDNDMQLEGESWGFGAHVAAHVRFNEQWSAGLSYKSQVTQNVTGDAVFGKQGRNLLVARGAPNTQDTNINGTIQLPDNLSLGIAWKPLPNLSFEVGGVYYRWSTFNALNIYFDNGYRSINPKQWSDSWNINTSVEYKPIDWLALRLGFYHDSSPLNESYSDFQLPTNGRDAVTAGVGVKWQNWTVDVAYAHLFIYPMSYDDTTSSGIRSSTPTGIKGGTSQFSNADIVSLSVGYAF